MKIPRCEKGNILSQYTPFSGKITTFQDYLLLLFGFFLCHIWTLLLVW
jgi:hypothetical protein